MGYDEPHQHRARTKPECYLFLRTPHGHSPNKNMVHRPHQPGPKKNPGKPQRKPLQPSDGAFTNAAPRRYLCANCATRSTEKRLRSSPTSILPSGRRTMHSAFPPPHAARSKMQENADRTLGSTTTKIPSSGVPVPPPPNTPGDYATSSQPPYSSTTASPGARVQSVIQIPISRSWHSTHHDCFYPAYIGPLFFYGSISTPLRVHIGPFTRRADPARYRP